ncbi:hypothetical protein F8237_34825 (plasmid) [Bradyrhizobium betae]|uniref:Uncharacterized protein n=1 Tax=Bradyrhizobium betae TaxID=244734 RepID=A0A5P6PHB5_9BRAD|nr:hypothetical protein F8237_34825 [Bradyrhizobium betae]
MPLAPYRPQGKLRRGRSPTCWTACQRALASGTLRGGRVACLRDRAKGRQLKKGPGGAGCAPGEGHGEK